MMIIPRRYQNLFSTIDEYKPRTLMEIGTHKGKHAHQMIKRAQKYNRDIKYYGFDIFEGIDALTRKKESHGKPIVEEKEVRDYLETSGAEIELHVGYTSDTLAKFYPPEEGIDFVFIDGGHSVGTIKNDWDYVKNIMSYSTVVIFDDYYLDETGIGCFLEVSQLQDDEEYIVEMLEPIDDFGVRKIQLARVTFAP